MNHKTFGYMLKIALVFITILQISCSDSVHFSSDDKQVLSQKLYVTPEHYNTIFFEPRKNVFLDFNSSVKITAEFLLNGEKLDANQATNYYSSVLWKINNEKFNIPIFRYTFREPGKNICTIQTIDNFGDTLNDTINIFVNTPTSISLLSPRDKFNQVNEFFEDTLSLKWDVKGLDPWETAICAVYGTNIKKNIWKNKLGETPCNESVNLIGRSYRDFVNESDSNRSMTYYWAVILKVYSEELQSEIDTSEIFSFSTKITNSEKSILSIPIVYDKMSVFDYPETIITITNAKGDTLIQDISYFKNDYITEYISPQTGVKVYLQNNVQTEFKANSFVINIPEKTNVIADTVIFTDNIAPTVWPINFERTANKNFKFIVLDKGSGINPNKVFIYKNGDEEIEGIYNDTLLSIPNIRDSAYTLSIVAYDKAGNTSIPVYWKVRTEKKLQILTGPYSEIGGLE